MWRLPYLVAFLAISAGQSVIASIPPPALGADLLACFNITAGVLFAGRVSLDWVRDR